MSSFIGVVGVILASLLTVFTIAMGLFFVLLAWQKLFDFLQEKFDL